MLTGFTRTEAPPSLPLVRYEGSFSRTVSGYEPSVPGVAISKRPVLALDEDEVDHDIVRAHA
jgi:hypothetical protein